jgi:thioredoxin-like negative regulator of GroEL
VTEICDSPAAPPRPALLFFYSETSGQSRRVDGYLAQVLQRRRNHETFRLYRVEERRRPDLVERFRVTSLPALVVVEGRRVRARVHNPRGVQAITAALAPWLDASPPDAGR